MKPKCWLVVVLIADIFLTSCGHRNEVKLLKENFPTEIAERQNLTFNFNTPLEADGLQSAWEDSTHYIEFSPVVAGSFRWNSATELVFSPVNGFDPGTEYTATLNPALLKHAKKGLHLSTDKTIQFHTPWLRVEDTHIGYTRGQDGGAVQTQLDINFNYEVYLSSAASRLSLRNRGNPIHFNTISTGNGKILSVQFAPLSEKDEEEKLDVAIAKGSVLATGHQAASRDTLFKIVAPSRMKLEISGLEPTHDGTSASVFVHTSQPVQEETLKGFITLEPATTYEVEAVDGGFMIRSDAMKAEDTYQLTIAETLTGSFGGRMKKNYSEQIVFPKPAPSISFTNEKGLYLSSKGFRNLELRLVGVPAVQVTVTKVYENNILHNLRSNGNYDDEEGIEEGGGYDYHGREEMTDTVFNQRYSTDKLPKLNSSRLLHLDFKDRLKGYSGVYIVTVSNPESNWMEEHKVLCLSDIGLIVKEEADKIYVFANSIRYARPVSGADISIISRSNQKLYTGRTNSEGVVVFEHISRGVPGMHVGMVTARSGDDFSFVWLKNSRVETSRFELDGRQPNGTGMNAWIYAERNLYRPGETAHIGVVLRDESWKTPAPVPLNLRLLMPNGRELSAQRILTQKDGGCDLSFPIPPAASTGTYTLQVFSGSEVLLNSYDVSVEDFLPDRMKASLQLDKTEYKPGEKIVAAIQADNLFGTPAAGRNYQSELNLKKETFSNDAYKGYNFRTSSEFEFTSDQHTGTTGTDGHATDNFDLKEDYAEAGILQGTVSATVFDETGRPIHRYAHFKAYTQDAYIGVKKGDDYVNTRQPLKIQLVALDKDGKKANGVNASVTVLRHEWNNVLEESGGSYRYISKSQEKTLKQEDIILNGNSTTFSFTPIESGDYEFRISSEGSDNYVSKTFYAWGMGDSRFTSFAINTEGQVDIQADKAQYRTGEPIKLLFTTPFEGRMLVTLERDHIQKYYYLNTNQKSASLTIRADEGAVPNVYVTATLFRPMDGTEIPLTVAHGFQSISVSNPANHLPLNVKMAAASRSKTKQVITVKTAPGAFVTIAAVDEGILQVKNYKTPDPYGYFYQKVALTTAAFDLYPLLLPELKGVRSSTGGDGSGESENMRVNPMFVNRARLVSFWSGILQADGSGIVRYPVNVPQFSGDLRVMAAAWKGKAFAGTDQHMKVADPIVISAGLPRVLSPGDEVKVPVTLSNTTTKAAEALVSINTEGPILVNGSTSQRISIPSGHESRVVFNITAQPAIGKGKVLVKVIALNESFSDETEIGIRPPSSLQKLSGSGTIASGSSTTVRIPANFISSSATGKLIVGNSPLLPYSKQLGYLVQYPYGCVEQTISTAFPQLYYADLVRASGSSETPLNTTYNVQQAINKLQSMQLPEGGLSYWPSEGDGSVSWWGSVYGAHFLMEARKAGYAVNDETLRNLFKYLLVRLQKRETTTLFYNNGQHRVITAKEIAYSLYVLALAGQPQLATMNYYKGNSEQLATDSRYLLAASYTLAGQSATGKQVLPPTFGNERAASENGGSFYSYVRDQGISLAALLDADPSNAQIPELARNLGFSMQQQVLNTQEAVWGYLALGKLAKRTSLSRASANVLVAGKSIGTTTGAPFQMDLKKSGGAADIRVSGGGPMYYYWESSGITADGSYKQEDKYIEVRRKYFDRTGKPINGTIFHQNDLVIVQLSLQSANSTGTVENIAITDMLPAGFEIENTRLNDLPEMSWIKDAASADYLDFRDDRLNLFTKATTTVCHFYYMVRAVSPGKYKLGPVQADAMYNAAIHSYNGAGIVQVNE